MTDDALLAQLRPYGFAVAYRMLGSVAEAEDIAQEALLRLHRELDAGRRLGSPRAFLATIATRLSIDHLRSARVRREQYVGEWLPEPILTDDGGDPEAGVELAESLSLAFLALLERLSPEQRAAFLLRDVFDYEYEEIASIVGTTPVNARQLAARARRHVTDGRPRYAASSEAHRDLAARFMAAARDGDVAGLEELLSADVVVHGDGGGKVPAIARPIEGRGHVARTLGAWFRYGTRMGISVGVADVNGEAGLLLWDSAGHPAGVMALEISDGRIRAIRSIVNPDKLAHLGDRSTPSA